MTTGGHTKRQRSQAFLVGVFIVMSVLTVYSLWSTDQNLRSSISDLQGTLKDTQEGQAFSEQQALILGEQVEELGARPIVDPKKGPPGPAGPAGPPPASAEIAFAVNSYCSGGRCGEGPSMTQVAMAVSTYCDSRGFCRGRTGPEGDPGAAGEPGTPGTPGENGASGKDGKDGAQGKEGSKGENGKDGAQGPPGEDAPAVTSDQIVQAVASYCGESGCAGPAGPQGPQGPEGATGAQGPEGVSAYPFRFSINMPDGSVVNYECSLSEGSNTGQCSVIS